MRFEDIAKKLTEEEGRYVTPNAVRIVYYKALKKLKKRLDEDPEYKQYLKDLIEEHPSVEPMVNEILNSCYNYEMDNEFLDDYEEENKSFS